MPITREVDVVINHASTVERTYSSGLITEVLGHDVHTRGASLSKQYVLFNCKDSVCT